MTLLYDFLCGAQIPERAADQIEQIRCHPDEIDRYHVFADLIEELGDSDWAETIRFQRPLPGEPQGFDAWCDRLEREMELMSRLRWSETVGEESALVLANGFPAVSASTLPQAAVALNHSYQARCLFTLVFRDAPNIRGLGRLPALQNLTVLELVKTDISRDDGYRELAETEYVENLVHFNLSDTSASAAGISAILGNPAFTRLQYLGLQGITGEIPWTRLAGPVLARLAALRHLWLTDNTLRPRHLGAVLGALADRQAAVETLGLTGTGLGDSGVAVLARHPALRGVRRLELARTGVTNAGATALVASPHLDALRWLDLRRNAVSGRAIAALRQRFGDRVVLDAPE